MVKLCDFYGTWYVNTHKIIEAMIKKSYVVVKHKNIVTLMVFGQKWPTIGNEWEIK